MSGAKFDARADFEVRLPPARLKPPENTEKLREIFEKQNVSKKHLDDFFFAENIRMYPNVSKCIRTGRKRFENVEKLRENVEICTFIIAYIY